MKLSHSILPSTLLFSVGTASPLSNYEKRDGAVTCYVELDTDHFGGDYAQLSLGSLEACGTACQADSRCVTAQYTADDGQCYLKNQLNVASSDDRVDSTVCRSPSSCTIVRGTDYFGGDYNSFSTGNFESCVGACQDDNRCVTAQYVQDLNMCYLKSVLNEASPDARVDSAVCRAPPTSTTTTSSITSASTTTASTLTTTTQLSTTTATTSLTPQPSACSIMSNTDHFGGDYSEFSTGSFENCVEACQNDDRCVTAQYAKNTNVCYLKSVLNEASSNALVDTAICRPPASASTSTTSINGASTTASTTANTSVTTTITITTAAITTSSGPTPSCTVIRQVEYFGGDYDSISASSFDDCVNACKLDSQCVTAQYRIAYQRCYLKSYLTMQTSDVNVDPVICRGPVQPGMTTTATTDSTTASTTAIATTMTTTTEIPTTTTTTTAFTTTASPTITTVTTTTSVSATATTTSGASTTATNTTPTTTTTPSATPTTTTSTTPIITTTTSATTTNAITTTTTSIASAPRPTSCSDAQASYCDNNGRCFCSVIVDHIDAYCWETGWCQNCDSDADCPTGARCAYDQYNFCGNSSRTICVINYGSCGSGTPPTWSAKRDLERVFEEAGRKVERDLI